MASQHNDAAMLASVWQDKPPASVQEAFQLPPNRVVKTLTIRTIQQAGDAATIQINVAVSNNSSTGKVIELHRALQCIKNATGWKIKQVVDEDAQLVRTLLLAKTAGEREELLKAHINFIHTDFITQLLDAGTQRVLQGDDAGILSLFETLQSFVERRDNKPALTATLRGIGNVHYFRADYEKAQAFYTQSNELAKEIGDKGGEGLATLNLGNIFRLRAHYLQAEIYYRRALHLAQQNQDLRLYTSALNNLGAIYMAQGNWPLALARCEETISSATKVNDLSLLAKGLINRGLIRVAQNDYRLAIADLQQGLKIATENKFRIEEYQALNNLAVAHEAEGRYPEALQFYQQSLALTRGLFGRQAQATILSNIGNVYRLQGNFTKSLDYFHQALALSQEFELSEVTWKAATRAARSYRALGEVEKAQQLLTEAVQVIEKTRAAAANSALPLRGFLDGRLSPYYEMAELHLSQDNIPAAFTWVQKAKGRVLLDIMQNGQEDWRLVLTAEEVKKRQELSREVASLNTQVAKEKLKSKADETVLTRLTSQLEKARLRYDDYLQELDVTHPELKMRRGEASVLSEEKIQRLLPDSSAALLEFVIADDKGYLFVITKHPPDNSKIPTATTSSLSFHAYPLAITRKDLSKNVEQFRRRLANKDFSYKDLSQQLYQQLLQPAAKQLAGKTSLIIVPDAALWELPFQALLSPQGRFLLTDYSLVYAPSLPVLNEMVKLRDRTSYPVNPATSLLAIGNPSVGHVRNVTEPAPLMNEEVAPLPEAEKQVRGLQRIYGATRSRIYLGAAAQEETVKAEVNNYRVLHFATHGLLEDANPLYSGLLLSQASGNTKEDGILEAREILNLRLRADLAVLSACETARGMTGSGEGLMGLSWALLVAGCPTLVLSQWKVESQSTATLMLEFHRLLQPKSLSPRTSLNIAASLRQAALKLAQDKRYEHPFYWAGFIVVGDGLKTANWR